MSGIFSAFNTARGGMFAQQQAISTTSHNIANTNTEGYSRQRVNLQTTPVFFMPGVGAIGTGVDVESIIRIRDSYLDAQIRYETGILGQNQARKEVLEQVEMIFAEPSDTGLDTTMGIMWDSWQKLGKNPENSTAYTTVLENSLTFTDNLNHMYKQLEVLKNDSISIAGKKVLDMNSILGQVQSLNDQIFNTTIKGQIPNDLMDRRDLLMDQLSQTVDFTSTEDQFGRVTIESGGEILLDAANENKIPQEISVVRSVTIDDDNNTVQVTLIRGGDSIDGITNLTVSKEEYDASYSFLQEGAVVFNDPSWDGTDTSNGNLNFFSITHGELKGYQDTMKEVDSYQAQLDGLARSIAYAVNMVHTNNGETGSIPFFVGEGDTSDITKISAANITVNSAIQGDVRLINVGKELNGPEGDGERALAIAQLRNARLPVQDFMDDNAMNSVINDPDIYNVDTMTFKELSGGTTFENYYKDIISEIGISAQEADRMIENQDALTGQLTQRKYSISGVSIDEEVTNLIQYQHAYQANAKVISTLTTMLDTLINQMGV